MRSLAAAGLAIVGLSCGGAQRPRTCDQATRSWSHDPEGRDGWRVRCTTERWTPDQLACVDRANGADTAAHSCFGEAPMPVDTTREPCFMLDRALEAAATQFADERGAVVETADGIVTYESAMRLDRVSRCHILERDDGNGFMVCLVNTYDDEAEADNLMDIWVEKLQTCYPEWAAGEDLGDEGRRYVQFKADLDAPDTPGILLARFPQDDEVVVQVMISAHAD